MQFKGITGFGVYLPSLRMSRQAIASAHSWSMPGLRGLGKGARAFCSWDEDPITMGVEALRNCRKAGPATAVDSVTFASTSAPFDDLQNAAWVAAAAGLPEDIGVLDAAGSLRAGTASLISAVQSQSPGTAYVVAADARMTQPGSPQEMHYGAGSAAIAIGDDDIIAQPLATHSVATQFIDHYRADDEKYDYYWEERWIRDNGYLKIVPAAVDALLEKAGVKADAIDHLCVPGTIRRLGETVARKLNVRSDAVVDNLAANVGDTGTPQPLLMLISALESAKAGDKILVIGFGSGCDVVLLEATEAISAYRPALSLSDAVQSDRVSEHYNQLLAFGGELQLDWGMRAEVDNKVALSQLYRAQDQVTRFNAGRCPNCEAVQFPSLPTCVQCGSTQAKTPVPLTDEPAQVATYSADNLQYYPSPPMYWGLVQFDNGARLLMEIVDVDSENFDIGTPLKMTYRIKQKDNRRQLHRYFWKATPA